MWTGFHWLGTVYNEGFSEMSGSKKRKISWLSLSPTGSEQVFVLDPSEYVFPSLPENGNGFFSPKCRVLILIFNTS